MPAPILTPDQIFQNNVNNIISSTAGLLNINSPRSAVWFYNNWYNCIFNYPGYTPAQAVTQLSTSAANTFSVLAALYAFLTACGISGITALPAYTANNDGTVTLS